jgi:hypothetical protein
MKNYIRRLHEKYAHLMGATFFVLGFLFDLLTLGRIDDSFNILIQFVYLLIAHLILISFEIKQRDYESKVVSLFMEYRNEVFHFLVGSLLSAFTIFYFKSSSFSNSFIFLIVIFVILLLNEFEFVQKLGLTMKALMLKICSLSFLIYLLPIIFSTSSAVIFYLALALSVGVSYMMKRYFLKKEYMDQERVNKEFFYPRVMVIAFFALMYIFKILPPLPMHLSYVGVFHKVEKQYPQYHLYHENPWWRFWQEADEDFKAREGDSVSVFFKVFSPGGFSGKVWVEWYHYNERSGDWQRTDRVPVAIKGGRGAGYRGYITKENYVPGDWEVIIKTDSDLILGTKYFTIFKDNETGERQFTKITDS